MFRQHVLSSIRIMRDPLCFNTFCEVNSACYVHGNQHHDIVLYLWKRCWETVPIGKAPLPTTRWRPPCSPLFLYVRSACYMHGSRNHDLAWFVVSFAGYVVAVWACGYFIFGGQYCCEDMFRPSCSWICLMCLVPAYLCQFCRPESYLFTQGAHMLRNAMP